MEAGVEQTPGDGAGEAESEAWSDDDGGGKFTGEIVLRS